MSVENGLQVSKQDPGEWIISYKQAGEAVAANSDAFLEAVKCNTCPLLYSSRCFPMNGYRTVGANDLATLDRKPPCQETWEARGNTW